MNADKRPVKKCLKCGIKFVLYVWQLPGPYEALVRSSTFDGLPSGYCSGKCAGGYTVQRTAKNQ